MSLVNSLPDLKANNSATCLGEANEKSGAVTSSNSPNGCVDASSVQCDETSECVDSKGGIQSNVETMIAKQLFQRTRHGYDNQNKPQQQNQIGRNAKKKHRRRYKSSKRKDKYLIKKEMSAHDIITRASTKSESKPLPVSPSYLKPLMIEVDDMKVPNPPVCVNPDIELTPPRLKRHSMVLGRKKFTLPIVSARSSRRIFPQKRYLQEEELDVSSKKKPIPTSDNQSSSCAASLTTARTNSPGNADRSKKSSKGQNTKRPRQPLIVTGKRQWKPQVKLQFKLLEKDLNVPAMADNLTSSTGTDFIKPDMVSKYADKMAEKPKERRPKNGESKKNVQNPKEEEAVERKEKPDLLEKKCVDPLERVAAKIEKILRSQWEGRLNQANVPPPVKAENVHTMKVKTSPLSQWKNEQEQRACDRKRTKNLIRKAKLQLKKRTLMKLRQPQSIALLNEQLKLENSKTGTFTEKRPNLSSPTYVEWPVVPIELKKSPVPPKFDVPATKACCVCSLSTTVSSVQKYYGQLACDACSKFFGNFIETPKQYFCSKDGNCSSSVKEKRNTKVSNTRYRCKACWLKSCMQHFSVSAFLRDQLLKFVPRLEAAPHNPLIEDSTALLKFSNIVDFAPTTSMTKPVANPDPAVIPEPVKSTIHDQDSGTKSLDKDAQKISNPDTETKASSVTVETVSEPSHPIDTTEKMPQQDTCLLPKSDSASKEKSPVLVSKGVLPVAVKSSVADISKNSSKVSSSAKDSVADEVSCSVLSKSETVPSVAKEELLSKPEEIKRPGPRIKHVCRRAAVVLGLPKATFTEPTTKKHFNLSALPREEKQKLLTTETDTVKIETKGSKVTKSCTTISSQSTTTKVSVDICKKQSLMIQKKQKKKKLLLKKSFKHFHKHSFKKPLKLTHKLLIKNQLKYSYKRYNKTAIKTPLKLPAKRTTRFRKVRCKQCDGCLAEDCGQCSYCLDKKKFGGLNVIKQACMFRRCLRPMMPASEKRALSSSKNSEDQRASIEHVNVDSRSEDSMIGIGTSLLNSSCSPSLSPDNSSCGSSCSSSSSSSSSGSSSSSSDSSSSSSNDSSNSKHSNSSNNNSSSHCSNIDNVSKDSPDIRNGMPQPSFLYETTFNNGFAVDFDAVSSQMNFVNSVDLSISDTLVDANDSECTSNSGSAKGLCNKSKRASAKNASQEKEKDCSNRNDRDQKEDDGRDKKHLIVADYWSQSREKVRDVGFALVTSKPLPHRSMCFLCGSAGKEKFIYCVVCCEPYHLFCADESTVPKNLEDWCCRNCQTCAVCGLKRNLLKCHECQYAYHTDCLGSFYPSKPSRKKKIWVCPKCVKCKSCGTTNPSPGSSNAWNFDLLLCHSCSRLKDKGNFCPICHKCYEDDDYDSEMMQCSKCNVWVHAKCEQMTDEQYQILSGLPETVVYTCFSCTVDFPPVWKLAVENAFDVGLKKIMQTLLNAKCTKHLVSRKVPNENLLSSTVIKPSGPDDSSQSSNSLLGICSEISDAKKEGNKKSSSGIEFIRTEVNPMEPNLPCDNLTIVTNLHKSDVLDKQFLSAASRCSEFSSPMSSKSSVTDSGIDCDNSEGDTEKSDVVGQQSDTQKCTFISAGIGESDATNTSSSSVDKNIIPTASNSCLHNASKIDTTFKGLTNELPCSRKAEGCTDTASISSSKVVCENIEIIKTENTVKVEVAKNQTVSRLSKYSDSVDLMAVKKKLSSHKYKSVSAFVNDVAAVLDSQNEEGMKNPEHVARSFCSKLVEQVFPWFKVTDSKLWDCEQMQTPNGLLPHASLPPSEDHVYATYLMTQEKGEVEQPSTFKSILGKLLDDFRKCALCGTVGDSGEKEKGRLLYCGQDDWIHLNCALWSAEVFQETDGVLKNVYSAISRGKLMRCEHCNEYGATVGCCVRGCPSNFHYSCGRKAKAIFQKDKKVFCDSHRYCNDSPIVKEDDFEILQRIYIRQEDIQPKWVKRSWISGMAVDDTHVMIGSLSIENLGYLTATSDLIEHLVPINFECTRMFWSTKNPLQRVMYKCRTIEVIPDDLPVEEVESGNLTIAHTPDTLKVEQGEQLTSSVLNSRTPTAESLTLSNNSDIQRNFSEACHENVKQNSIQMHCELLQSSKCESKIDLKTSNILQKPSIPSGHVKIIEPSLLNIPIGANDNSNNNCDKKEKSVIVTDFSAEISGLVKAPVLKEHQSPNVTNLCAQVSEFKPVSSNAMGIERLKSEKMTKLNGFSHTDVDLKNLSAIHTCRLIIDDIISKVISNLSKQNNNNSTAFISECGPCTKQNSVSENVVRDQSVSQLVDDLKCSHSSSLKKCSKRTRSTMRSYPLRSHSKHSEFVSELERQKTSIIENHVLDRYTGLPQKMDKLIDAILPSSPVTETVLPVFHVEKFSKMNGHLDHSSSCSEDSYEKESRLLRQTPARLSKLKSDSSASKKTSFPYIHSNHNHKLKSQTKMDVCERKEEHCNRNECGDDLPKNVLINGTSKHCILMENDVIERDPLVTTDLQNDNITTVMDKVMAYNLSKNHSSKNVDNRLNNKEIISMCKKLTANGYVQDLGPFKCNKCKRSYRTKTSFETHISSCDFIVDSSSDEEEENSRSPPPSQKLTVNNIGVEKEINIVGIEEKSQTLKQNLADELGEVVVLQEVKERSGSEQNNESVLVNGNNRESEHSVNRIISSKIDESYNTEHKIEHKVNLTPETYHVVECNKNVTVPEEKTVLEFMDCSSGMPQNIDNQMYLNNTCENTPLTSDCRTDKNVQLSKCEEVESSFDNPMPSNTVLYNAQSVNVLPENHFSRNLVTPTSRSTVSSQGCSSFSQNFSPRQIFPKTSQPSVHILPNSQSLHQPLQMHPNQPSHMHPNQPSHMHPIHQTINQQSVNVQQVSQPINATLNPLQQLNHYNSVPIEQCGANVDVVSIPLASSNFQDSMALGYGNNAYRNPHPDVVQMPNGTLIFPQDSNLSSQTIPTVNGMPIMTNGFPQLFSPTIDLNQNSQLSYVGSITITNSASMSLSLNMPGQIMSNIPLYPSQVIPQQNLAFGQPQLMQAPLQLQPNSAVQLSTLNVQQLTLQSSCGATGLTPMVFPAQTPVQGVHSPVMFVEEAAVQSQMNAMSSFSQSSNLVLQMPMGIDQQPQNCYQTFVPNNFAESPTFTPHTPENFCENNILDSNMMVPCNVQTVDPCVSSYSLNPTSIPSSVSSFENNIVCQRTYNTNSTKPAIKAILPKVPVSNQCISSPVCIKPVDDAARNISVFPKEQNSGPNPAADGNIVDIIKKAAQQMLNLSAELAKKKSATPDPVPQPPSSEKKTRFAHTRKVAARKAQQLKMKQLRTHACSPVTISSKQPEYLHLKISAVPANQAQFNSSPSTNVSPDLRIVKTTEQICHVSPQHLDVSHSVVIDQSSQDLFELNNDDSALLNLYQEKEKQAQHDRPPKNKPHIIYEISSEDGFYVQSHNIHDAWAKVYEELQDARIASKMHQIMFSKEDINGIQMMGLNNKILTYLLEQLPGSENCVKYKFSFHKPVKTEKLPENPSGCARSETFANRREYDMFNFLASEHRDRPVFQPVLEEDEGAHKSGRRATNTDLSMAMRFRHLKTIARETVGVYRSSIHGRGLFCKRNIDPGELVIEYAGEVIRSVLTDKREQMYQSKGIGCYMFRIDDDEVVDATMHGNAARFINHSCEPNCFSKVINVDGKKHIVIFALRKILRGEELTYDYKFPFEDEKIPCSCNSRRCRKYLN